MRLPAASLRLIAALLLPIVVLAGLVVRAERLARAGRKWQVRITGYDPRDLVSGQYLRYRIAWDFADAAEPTGRECEEEDGCIFCLVRRADDAAPLPEPLVRRKSRREADTCDSFFPVAAEAKLHRYFIPEGMGERFESAVRDKKVHLQLSISASGQVAVTELLIDGVPWRSVLTP